MRILAVIAASLGLAVVPAGATAAFRVDGHGFGHGVGLAQYGALGYARDGHRTATWILGHYYPGTRIAAGPRSRMLVRLKEAVALRVAGATLARGADGRLVTLTAGVTWRFSPWSADAAMLTVEDAGTHRARAHLHAPVRLTGPAPLRLLGLAENGVTDGRYRGALSLRPAAGQVLAVGDVDLEQYLWGVVGAEMPAGWPAHALRAQAIAARSYALTSRSPGAPFDVFADTRSQMYRGVSGEAAATTAAVTATRAQVVLAGSAIARTLFSSSSGGRTAANEEAFPGAVPLSYLRSVDDPYDRLAPHHDWTVSFGEVELARRLAPVLDGTLTDLGVVARTPGDRAATVRVTGSGGSRDVPAATIRSLLGLRSTWFAISRTAG